MARQLERTERTTHRRLPERGSHDVAEAYAILDEALYCHVGFVVDGKPVVIPTIHARDGDRLVLHGSVASRMLRALKGGADACVAVTLLDGLVMARSAFHHSMNYRSVIVFGTARLVEDEAAKLAAMAAITEHIAQGRWDDARQPNRQEAMETMIIEIPLNEASVKTRTGPPGDDDEDMGLDVWAGVIPVVTAFGEPAAAPDLDPSVELPPYLAEYRR
jgi:nitroimidazol reductase NimA-like FMN-containing flavoprotein (pyridoxamine 5'-phosphate oxidase superfamily)